MRVGFGLDLAGYSTGKSELAVALIEETSASVILLRGSPFSSKVASDNLREPVEQREGAYLKRILSAGPLAVDVPIDLQGLPAAPTSAFVWGRTRRPIDQALNGLPPLADKIGAVVARFQAALVAANVRHMLGVRLYETYPAASFAKLGILTRGYKNAADHDIRAAMCQRIGLGSAQLCDDEIDAIICALTAAGDDSDVLEGASLGAAVFAAAESMQVRIGYRLLTRLPTVHIQIGIEDCDSWMGRNGY